MGLRAWSLALGLCAALAPGAGLAGDPEAKFTRLDGGVLLYNTETIGGDPVAEIEEQDIAILRRYLDTDPEITTLRLHSYGGSVWAAFRMADILIDFGLDTEIFDECASACTVIFLAGAQRRMARGARLGFHNWTWSREAIEEYYELRKEPENWADPLDFAAWLYVDTQRETEQVLRYQVERGVDPAFAIELLFNGRDGLYYPRRDDLEAAGVLRD